MRQGKVFFPEGQEDVYTGIQLRDWKESGEPVQEFRENLPV